MVDANWQEQSQEDQQIWNQKAGFWDDYMGEGNGFQRTLVNPASLNLLQLKPGEEVLEIACGNGSFSRLMASAGAKVTAFDFSEVFLERARARSVEFGSQINYRLIDATDRSALESLGVGRFDAAVCNMALMDMANIDVLAEMLPTLLKPNGRFVFTISHPIFNTNEVTKMVEEIDHQGKVEVVYSLKLHLYLTPGSQKGTGVIGEPLPHRYYHRPLHMLLGVFMRNKLVLDAMLEPAFPHGEQSNRPTSWENYAEFPAVLSARFRNLA